jgi:hypothetical protein
LRKISPKKGITMQVIRDALDKYVAGMNEAPSEAVRATYGHVVEEPEKLIAVVGNTEVACVPCIACTKLILSNGRVVQKEGWT